jgi:hypothetical protein
LIPAIYLIEIVDQSDVALVIKFRGSIDSLDSHVLSFSFREGIRVRIVAVGASCGLQIDLINLP